MINDVRSDDAKKKKKDENKEKKEPRNRTKIEKSTPQFSSIFEVAADAPEPTTAVCS